MPDPKATEITGNIPIDFSGLYIRLLYKGTTFRIGVREFPF